VQRSVVFAGFGGQGLLFAAEILAEAALAAGRETIWIPSYGPEMRGGTASCTVIVADEPIGSPALDAFDMAVVLNQPSLVRFGPLVAPGGIAVVNASLAEAELGRTDVLEVRVPCTRIAGESGHERLTAVVGLAALVAASGRQGRDVLPRPEAVRAALEMLVSRRHPRLLEANLRAFEAGATQREGSMRSSPA
jgi:2-oxoglutarate ferredoxin oxidoreductase subunit gamma